MCVCVFEVAKKGFFSNCVCEVTKKDSVYVCVKMRRRALFLCVCEVVKKGSFCVCV